MGCGGCTEEQPLPGLESLRSLLSSRRTGTVSDLRCPSRRSTYRRSGAGAAVQTSVARPGLATEL
jgi:hypothetical protein